MRFLRMFSNAVTGAFVAAGYVAILILYLNPALRLDDAASWPLIGSVLLAYGVHVALVFYAVIVLRQVLSTETVSPGWLSYGVLSWFCSAAAGVAAALMWLNLRGFSAALDSAARDRFVRGAIVVTACAAACVLLAILRTSFGRRSRPAAIAFGLVVIASLAVPVAIRGVGAEAPREVRRPGLDAPLTPEGAGHRVHVLAIDGASLDFISPAAADGRLPNFARLLDAGASMHLATLRPTQPGPVWTAVATGKLPAANGVRSAATYAAAVGSASIDLLPDFCFAHAMVSSGLLTQRGQNSRSVRAHAVWSILSRAGLSASIVRWPLTWPAQPARGTIVSEQYHQTSDITLALDEPGITYPATLALSLRRSMPPSPSPALFDGQQVPRPDRALIDTALGLDRLYLGIADEIEQTMPASFSAVRLQGLDAVGHRFLRYAVPRAFGDVSEDERRQYGRVLEQYYRFVDIELGRQIDRLAPGDLLLVVSPFGLEPLSLPKRLLEGALGNAELSGTHERAPDGFLIAYGSAVRPGRYARGSVADVTPTVLYFFGLPVGRDMDGFARADLFSPAFTAEHPIAYIPSYER